MDASIFIANKKVLWIWIFLPLVVRFTVVFLTYKLTAGYLEGFDKEKVYASVVEQLEAEMTSNDWVLKRFSQKKDSLVNERFYQHVADRNLEYNVQMNAEVVSDRTKKATGAKVAASGQEVYKYEMSLGGTVPTVYVASSYLADLLTDPLISIQSGRLTVSRVRNRMNAGQKPDLNLEANFTRLSLNPSAGGAK